MKVNIKELIDEILEDELVIKPNIQYQYKNDTIEIVFIENSNYIEHFEREEITNKYLFDYKGKKHLLLLNQRSYELYQDLYSEMVILATLRLFVNRRSDQKRIKTYAISTIVLITLLNIAVLIFNPFKKVFYVPIISLVIIGLIFVYASKIIERTYEEEKLKTEKLLLEKLPKLASERNLDSYHNIKEFTKE